MGIQHIFSHNDRHSFPAERVISTIKKRLFKYFKAYNTLKWIDVLPHIVEGYNNSPHSALCNGKYTPNQVSEENAAEIEEFMRNRLRRYVKPKPHDAKIKFPLNSLVLMGTTRGKMEKGCVHICVW